MEGSVSRRFEAVVFDLFGTLVPEFVRTDFGDTVRAMADALGADPERFRSEWDRTAIERQTGLFATVETNVRAICASIGLAPSDGAMERALEARLDLYRKLFHPRSGALETLAAVKERGYGTALVSMCAPDAPAMWRASPLAPHIDVEVFSSETGLRKPDPAIYGAAAEGLGVETSACLYVGDGANGELTGAEAVGMTAYLLADPEVDPLESLTPQRDDWQGARVSDLRELLDLVPDRRRAARDG